MLILKTDIRYENCHIHICHMYTVVVKIQGFVCADIALFLDKLRYSTCVISM